MARLVPKRGRSYLSAGHVIPARSQFLLRSDGVECPLIKEKLAGPWKYEKGKRHILTINKRWLPPAFI